MEEVIILKTVRLLGAHESNIGEIFMVKKIHTDSSTTECLVTELNRPLKVAEVLDQGFFVILYCERCEHLTKAKEILIRGSKGSIIVSGKDLDIPQIRDCLGYWTNMMVAVRKPKSYLDKVLGQILTVEFKK